MGSAEKCAQQIEDGINAKKCLSERVIVPTALHTPVAWGMRSAGVGK